MGGQAYGREVRNPFRRPPMDAPPVSYQKNRISHTHSPFSSQLYLPRSSLDTDVTTAKSSGVNIVVLGSQEESADDADGPAEAAVPEQFVTRFRDGAWVTTPVSHSGA